MASPAKIILTPVIVEAMINANTATDNLLVDFPATGKRIRVTSFFFICTGQVSVQFKSVPVSGPSNTLTPVLPFLAYGGLSLGAGGLPVMSCNVDEKLMVNLSGAVQCGGRLSYYVE
jgi:hypothetical protein